MNLTHGTSTVYAFPPATVFGRVLPKSKLFEQIQPSARLRNLFTSQIQQIIWMHKLAPETLQLAPTPAVPEIQVFELVLKSSVLDEAVLRSIDQAIPFPLLFQLKEGERIQTVAAYKRPHETEKDRWVLGDSYFYSPWLPDDTPRSLLPMALNLESLYHQLLQTMIPLPARTSENIADFIERYEIFCKKKSKFEKINRIMQKEKQFNRKIELNRSLRQLYHEIEILRG